MHRPKNLDEAIRMTNEMRWAKASDALDKAGFGTGILSTATPEDFGKCCGQPHDCKQTSCLTGLKSAVETTYTRSPTGFDLVMDVEQMCGVRARSIRKGFRVYLTDEYGGSKFYEADSEEEKDGVTRLSKNGLLVVRLERGSFTRIESAVE